MQETRLAIPLAERAAMPEQRRPIDEFPFRPVFDAAENAMLLARLAESRTLEGPKMGQTI